MPQRLRRMARRLRPPGGAGNCAARGRQRLLSRPARASFHAAQAAAASALPAAVLVADRLFQRLRHTPVSPACSAQSLFLLVLASESNTCAAAPRGVLPLSSDCVKKHVRKTVAVCTGCISAHQQQPLDLQQGASLLHSVFKALPPGELGAPHHRCMPQQHSAKLAAVAIWQQAPAFWRQ